MNRKEFMEKLSSLLSDISESEREEALQYYNDYFNDAGAENEQNVIKALGTPEHVAETVKEGLNENKLQGEFTEQGFKDNVSEAQKNEVIKTDNISSGNSNAGNAGNTQNAGTNTNTVPGQDAVNNANATKKKSLPTWAIVLIIAGSIFLISAVTGIFLITKAVIENSIPEELDDIKEELPDIIEDTIEGSIGETVSERMSGKYNNITGQFNTSDIDNLDIDFGAGTLTIMEKDTDDGIIDLTIKGYGTVKYGIDDEKTLKIDAFSNVKKVNVNGSSKNSAEILIPAGYIFDEVQLELGACQANISGLNASEIEAKIGACDLTIQNIKADELEFDIGVGNVNILSTDIKDAEFKVGLGTAIFNGNISGNLDAEVGMGTADFILKGKETDFNYNLQCAMGAIEIGDTKISAVSNEEFINNGASGTLDLKCGMGNITVKFEE